MLHMNLCALILIVITANFASGDNKKLRELMEEKAREQGIDPNNLRPGETFMIPPELSDEEEGSHHMPQAHRCDGCTAVAFQLDRAFTKAHKQVKKGALLSLADVIDVTELVCDKRMKDYGLKNVNDVKMLSGPGLKNENTPGIVEAGGKWENRLSNLCKELIEKYEEEGIYEFYRKKGDNKLAASLCKTYCSKQQIQQLQKDEL
ncbi:marginal zone B- and B1-cell-specific protein-like [Physella acuta]|uniref:marginal zone B- and B1-cell-specific protein-like n=1 Tax=Physella acuta TaxID=109671 RepID=UPI0027DE595E|nr:marginal zone B- and B1-cell-specific protein-like [Physella acuta]